MKTFFLHRHKILLATAVSLVFLFRGGQSVGHAFANLGMVQLIHAGANVEFQSSSHNLAHIEQTFVLSQQWEPLNTTSLRGLAMIAWQQGNEILAQEKWQATDLNADDFLTFARYGRFLNKQTVLPWYYLLERLAPEDPRLWLDVGLLCQQQIEKDPICQHFLTFNDQNWLVDSQLTFNRTAWTFNRKPDVIYEIENCPGLDAERCLKLELPSPAPESGASWQQCLYVEAGATYRFSTWLKVDTVNDGEWRPLYFQGAINGTPSGHWPSTENGPTDWQYWEHIFTMPTFDDNRACFHPIHTRTSRSVWLYDPRLKSE